MSKTYQKAHLASTKHCLCKRENHIKSANPFKVNFYIDCKPVMEFKRNYIYCDSCMCGINLHDSELIMMKQLSVDCYHEVIKTVYISLTSNNLISNCVEIINRTNLIIENLLFYCSIC